MQHREEKHIQKLESSYTDLWNKVLDALQNHFENYTGSSFKIAMLTLESVMSDQNGINKHAKNNTEKFHNLLKFIDGIRLQLVSQGETNLSAAFTKIIKDRHEALQENTHFPLRVNVVLFSRDAVINQRNSNLDSKDLPRKSFMV